MLYQWSISVKKSYRRPRKNADLAADHSVANPPHPILEMQSNFGNKAVQRYLQVSSPGTIQRFMMSGIMAANLAQQLEMMSDEDLQKGIDDLRSKRKSLDPADPDYHTVATNLAGLLHMQRHRRIKAQLTAVKEADLAGKTKVFREQAMTLVELVREEVQSLGNKIDTFNAQPTPSPEEKVAVLGQLAALVARMEYLAGRIYHKGQRTWETAYTNKKGQTEKKDNRGPLVNYYKSGKGTYNWCAAFATSMWAKARNKSSMWAASGYKVAHPQQFQKTNEKTGEVSGLMLDYEGAGGAFAGLSNEGRYKAQGDDTKNNYNPFFALREELIAIDEQLDAELKNSRHMGEKGFLSPDLVEAERQRIAEQRHDKKRAAVASFTSQNLKPQPGDIMDVRTDDNPGKQGGNPNAYKKTDHGVGSHTALVERYENYKIYTVEGNVSNGRVSGFAYDLTDPNDVALIIMIARPSLASGTDKRSSNDEIQAPERSPVDADQLLAPVRDINSKLTELALDVGVIDQSANEWTAVAGMEGPEERTR
jgi:hypothetical protein